MSQENVDVVRSMYEAQRDPAKFLAYLDPHVVFINYDAAPEAGPFVGHRGVGEWVRTFQAGLGDFRLEPTEFIDAGESHVIVVQRVVGSGPQSGIPFEQELSSVITLLNRKVIRVQGFKSRAEALEAAGLSE